MNRENGFRWDAHSLVWVAGIVTASAVYGMLVAWPELHRVNALYRDVNTRQAELASRTQSIDTLVQAGREVSELAARAANFEARVPEQSMLGSFLEDVARVAQERKLQSDVIQPGEPMRTAEVVALPISIKVRGPFSAVHGFLQDIERMPRLTHFDYFKVLADEQHPGLVKADLSLTVFYGSSPQGVKAG